MKRLLHIVVLALAIMGLTAPGLMAQGVPGHCHRGTIWTQSQQAAGLPVSVERSGLPASLKLSVCPDYAIVGDATPLPAAPRPALPLPRTQPAPQAALAEAELPPPRG